MGTPLIIISKPKFIVNMKCPHCNSEINSVKSVKIKCIQCGKDFIKEPEDFINYNKNNILMKLQEHNDIVIQCPKDFEDFFLRIVADLKKYKVWEISEIEWIKAKIEKRFCKDCGFCLNCHYCKSCGNIYKKNDKFRCPKCKSFEKKSFYFKKSDEGRCPNCGNAKIINTIAYEDRCPKCGGNNITPQREIDALQIIVKRYPRDMLKEGR